MGNGEVKQGEKPDLLTQYVPIAGWLPGYESKWLTRDAIAGLTVWALLVPEAMAYASLAGMPPETGLYAAIGAMIGYAIFGTSRQLFVGPSSTVAVLSAATIAPIVAAGSDDFVALSVALALVVGVLFVVFGLLRFGFVAQFLAKPVLTGFIFGLAMVIAIGQADEIFGVEGSDGNFWQQLWGLITELGDTHVWTFVIGAGALVILFALAKWAPKAPGALIVVALGIIVSAVLNLEDKGVHIVGEIPAGLPSLGFPDVGWSEIVDLIPGALSIVLVGYVESLAAAKQYAVKHGYEVDPNQELIALGTSNLGAGLFGGFVVDGSLSRTAANDEAGAKTQMSNILNLVLVIVTALLLTPLFHDLPEAVLGAIVIHAVWHLMDIKALQHLWNVYRVDFLLAVTCILGVTIFDLLPGLLIAVALSLLMLIYRASRPALSVLGRSAETGEFGDVLRHPDYETVAGLIVFRADAPLFFANAEVIRDRIRELVATADPAVRAIIFDAESNYDLDTTAADTLDALYDELVGQGVRVMIARVHSEARVVAERTGLIEKVGPENIFPTVRSALASFRESDTDPAR